LGHRVYIRLQPKRYECLHCAGKTTTQALDWYETKSPHTKSYDHYLMLQLINSTVEDVSRKENVGYDAVEGAIGRCIQSTVDWDEFVELGIVGIDEIALIKGRRLSGISRGRATYRGTPIRQTGDSPRGQGTDAEIEL
jgi:hypothetical protein